MVTALQEEHPTTPPSWNASVRFDNGVNEPPQPWFGDGGKLVVGADARLPVVVLWERQDDKRVGLRLPSLLAALTAFGLAFGGRSGRPAPLRVLLVHLLSEDDTGHGLWEIGDGEFAAALERVRHRSCPA